jgi:hypothetical protein
MRDVKTLEQTPIDRWTLEELEMYVTGIENGTFEDSTGGTNLAKARYWLNDRKEQESGANEPEETGHTDAQIIASLLQPEKISLCGGGEWFGTDQANLRTEFLKKVETQVEINRMMKGEDKDLPIHEWAMIIGEHMGHMFEAVRAGDRGEIEKELLHIAAPLLELYIENKRN